VFSGAKGNQITIGDIDSASVSTTVSVPSGSLSAIATLGVTITGNGSGSVTLTGDPAAVTAALNGLSYTPVADYNGSVTMTVSTSDGVAAPVAGTVALNLAPVADIVNDTATTAEDTSKVISVLGNDSFENSGAAVTSVTNGAHGSVTINGDGTVTYMPNANYNGTDSFTYTVTSGGVTETATVTVNVTPVNDPPVQTIPTAQTIAEDTPLTFSAATGNPITVADVDGDTLTITVSATNGTFNLGAISGVTASGGGTGTIVLTGSAAAINSALDGLILNPTADYNGSAVMTVTTTDGTATVSGAIPLTITPVADIANDAVATNEDTPVAVNVLTNDSFENPAAAVTSVSQGAHGTVSIGSNGQLTYTPNANYNGPDSFTYTVTSGGVTETATVTVNVAPVNDPHTLILQISNTLSHGSKEIVDYRITQTNGAPLPGWLDRAGRDLLIGERSAADDILKLRIEAVYSDGSTVTQEVKIDTATGEIQPLKAGKQGSAAPALFRDQLKARSMLSPDQVEELARALAG
jgi:VCBS repeat-containing protein